jgi:16S rRNA (cytosine1402-N4)-methyltransferase
VFQPYTPDMANQTSTFHVPVLLAPVLDLAREVKRAVDGTIGDGGHAAGLLELGAEVLGIDRDSEAIAISRARLGEDRIQYLQAEYSSDKALAAVAQFEPDFILLDLGVSSRQLDQTSRGFTFRPGAPLDMRMGGTGETAADLLNRAAPDALETIFREYGDERKARRLAVEVVRRRKQSAFAASDDFVNAIRATLGPRAGAPEFARLFQALRIAVNEELSGLKRALPSFRDALKPGGQLSIITYHSGEDRLVKQLFREWARSCVCPPGLPVCVCRGRAYGRVEPRKPVLPDTSEVAMNPRSRSAKLRNFVVGNAA